mgnify:CR=1 FL=1
MKTSMLNACNYWTQHRIGLGRALNITDDMIEALDKDYQNSAYFSDAEKAATLPSRETT